MKALQNSSGAVCDRYAHAAIVEQWLMQDQAPEAVRTLAESREFRPPPRYLKLGNRRQHELMRDMAVFAADKTARRFNKLYGPL